MQKFLNKIAGASAFALLCLVTGCTVGPTYQAPELEVPCEWQSLQSPNVTHEASEDVIWWENLGDPLLNEFISCAASQNLDLQIAANRVLQARLEANAKKADLYPRLDASANFGHVYCSKEALKGVIDAIGANSCGTRRNLNFYEIGFDAEWELDFFGFTKHEIAAMKANEEAVEENLNAVWVTLSAEIAKNYIELRSFQQRLQRMAQTKQSQADAINLTQELLERGVVNESDFNRLKAEWNTLQGEISQIQYNIFRCMHRIAILLGYAPGDLYASLSIESPLPELPCKIAIGIPSELLRRRPDVRKVERELAAATERIGSAIANLFPRFSLRGFIGEISTHSGSLFSPASATWFAGPQVLIPIFNSRLLLQEVDYNKLVTQEVIAKYQKAVLEALEEAENAIVAFKFEEERFFHLKEAVQNQQKAFAFTRELYEKGVNDLFAVENARKLLLAAEDNAIQSHATLVLNYISLYKALGGSWGKMDENNQCEIMHVN